MSDKSDTTLKKAEASVIRAAVAWVNFEDDGMIGSMKRQVRINHALANSVTRLEKVRKNAKRRI